MYILLKFDFPFRGSKKFKLLFDFLLLTDFSEVLKVFFHHLSLKIAKIHENGSHGKLIRKRDFLFGLLEFQKV